MPSDQPNLALPDNPTLRDCARYMCALEQLHGWDDVDLVTTCFLLGEEVGELFAAVRAASPQLPNSKQPPVCPKSAVAEELVDVFNYLLAIADRLDIDLAHAFAQKNARNEKRTWQRIQPPST